MAAAIRLVALSQKYEGAAANPTHRTVKPEYLWPLPPNYIEAQ
jgi:hypothetical protein